MMFNLDNFDLEFDDDFPPNIFSDCLTGGTSEKKENKQKSLNKSSCDLSNFQESETLKRQIQSSNDITTECETKKKKLMSDVSSNDICDFKVPEKSSKSLSNTQLKRLSFQNEKPQKKTLYHDGLIQRKFPGPAGLLPDRPFKELEDYSSATKKSCNEEVEETEKEDSIIYSQSSGSVFLESSYQKLVSDFELNEPSNPLTKYTVEWVKKSAANKALQGRKIPFLAVILHCINNSTPDPVLSLRDPTGEINGTLHREVWADMGGKLKSGIALALRQVGVLITGVIRRQIYLNITINNILAIYSLSENDREVDITTINKVSRADLFKSIEGWKVQALINPLPKSPDKNITSSLFSTVSDFNSPTGMRVPRVNNEEIYNLRNKLHTFLESTKPASEKGQNGKEVKTKDSDEALADLGIILSDSDFSEDMNIPQNKPSLRTKEARYGRFEPKPKRLSDAKETTTKHTDRGDSSGGGQTKPTPFQIDSSKVLSQAESLIFEEVLSGINLDEFEM